MNEHAPMPTTYSCALCGAMATIVEGQVAKTCEHKEAGVVAHLRATASGECRVAA